MVEYGVDQMNRNEIEKNFQVKNGKIMTPGKFENESVYLPAFWALVPEVGEEVLVDRHIVHQVEITPDLRKSYPELNDQLCVYMVEAQGYVLEVSAKEMVHFTGWGGSD